MVLGKATLHQTRKSEDAQSPRESIRRSLLSSAQRIGKFAAAIGSIGALVSSSQPPEIAVAQQFDIPPFPSRGFQTKSGLKYFDFNAQEVDGLQQQGPTPRYGQLVTFHYTIYYRETLDSPLQVVDSTLLNPGQAPFLQKHGNGRLIAGLEEGLHGMHVGQRRRVVLPRSLGYTRFGLGPLPQDAFRRRRLGDLLDAVDAGRGELVLDLQLLAMRDDENDQGYYEDVPVSQEEVRRLVLRSLQSDNPELLQKIKATTPKGLLKKL